VNGQLASWLTAAHAPAWRRRYGHEFRALLEELPATPANVASVAGSVLASQVPALAAIGVFALAAAVLALGPAASDRRVPTAQTHVRPAAHGWPHTALGATCTTEVADVVADGWAIC
jgi:hypothetical protein